MPSKGIPMHRASAEPARRAAEKLIDAKPLDPSDEQAAKADLMMFGSFVQCVTYGRLHPIQVRRDSTLFAKNCDDCEQDAAEGKCDK